MDWLIEMLRKLLHRPCEQCLATGWQSQDGGENWRPGYDEYGFVRSCPMGCPKGDPS